MAYSVAADLRTETPFKNTSNFPDSLLEQKIDEGDQIINSKIGDVYSLPLSVAGVETSHDVINMLSKNLATGLLYLHQFSEEAVGIGNSGQDLIDQSMAILDDIQTQKQKLRNASGVEFDRISLLKVTSYPSQSSTDDGDTEPLTTINESF